MTATLDISAVLVQLAADHVRKSPVKLDKTRQDIAIRHAGLFGQILPIVESFMRAPNETNIEASVLESLKHLPLTATSAEKCLDVLKDLKSKALTSQFLYPRHFHSLSNTRWRVDITISSSVLSRVLEPTIIMELALRNGDRVTFELSVAKFHKLRYTVALILKEMDHMNNKMSAIKV